MTIHSHLDDGAKQYDITVRTEGGVNQVYRTKSVLSDRGDSNLLGGGTRVWAAVRVENGEERGELVALKDSWVDAQREREGSLNFKIRAAGTTQQEHNQIDGAVVRVLAYGDVHVAGVRDCTKEALTSARLHVVPRASVTDILIPLVVSENSRIQVHSRVVYADIGQPIDRPVSVTEFFSSLAQAAQG